MDTSINRRDFIKAGIVAAAVPMIGIAEAKADDRLPNLPALRMRQVHLDFHTSELIPALARSLTSSNGKTRFAPGM